MVYESTTYLEIDGAQKRIDVDEIKMYTDNVRKKEKVSNTLSAAQKLFDDINITSRTQF